MIREKLIKKLTAGKDVLDVGAVGQNSAYCLWREIKSACRRLTGIDIAPSDNPDVVIGNMETYDFKYKFEVIILGDIIEHVDNQGLLLDNVRRHLKPDGLLIITTPNAKWPTVFTRTNPTHTLWHDKSTLSVILRRHGFVISDFQYYYGNKNQYNILLRPLIIRQGMIAVCRIKDNYAKL